MRYFNNFFIGFGLALLIAGTLMRHEEERLKEQGYLYGYRAGQEQCWSEVGLPPPGREIPLRK